MISVVAILLLLFSCFLLLFVVGPENTNKTNAILVIAFGMCTFSFSLMLTYVIPLAEKTKEYKLVDNPDGSTTWEFVNIKK